MCDARRRGNSSGHGNIQPYLAGPSGKSPIRHHIFVNMNILLPPPPVAPLEYLQQTLRREETHETRFIFFADAGATRSLLSKALT